MVTKVSSLALAKNRDGRLELVATSWSDQYFLDGPCGVWRRSQTGVGAGWVGWQSLPIPWSWGYGPPAVAQNKDGRLEVVVSYYSDVRHCWQTAPNGPAWKWESLGLPGAGGGSFAPPALAQNKDERLEIFVAGGGPTTVWHCWQRTSGGWSPWESLGSPGGRLREGAKPVVERNKDGRLELFIKAEDKAVWHCWQRRQGGWSDWESLEAPTGFEFSEPLAVARNHDGRLEVFAIDNDRSVWHRWQRRPRGWSDWESLGRPTNQLSQMVVGAHADGRLVLFAVDAPSGKPNDLWQREQAVSGGWSAWRAFSRIDPPVVKDPALALDGNRRLELWLCVSETVDLYRLRQISPNGSEWDARGWFARLSPAVESTEPGPGGWEPTPAGSEEKPPK